MEPQQCTPNTGSGAMPKKTYAATPRSRTNGAAEHARSSLAASNSADNRSGSRASGATEHASKNLFTLQRIDASEWRIRVSDDAGDNIQTAGSATEHAAEEWCDAIAFSNVGLAGKAIQGLQWHTNHRPRLLTMLRDLLLQSVMGICLSQVGNMSDPLNQEGRGRVEDLAIQAFDEAGALEHGDPQVFWSKGETMAMFRAEARIEQLTPMTNIQRIDSWRTVDKFKVTGATKHGPVSLLIFNQHQPKSSRRRFDGRQQINLCRAVLKETIRFREENPENIGFGFGGDANCTMIPWNSAFFEIPEARLTFSQLQFIRGVGTKESDLMVGAGTRGTIFKDNDCEVQGRDQQHDPTIMRWCYRAQPEVAATQRPTRFSEERKAASFFEERIPINDSSPIHQVLRRMGGRISQVFFNRFYDELNARGADIRPPTPTDCGNDTEDIAEALAMDTPSDIEDTLGAPEHDENQHDELHTTGLAIAQSMIGLIESTAKVSAENCLEVAKMKVMDGTCAPKDRQALEHYAAAFFVTNPHGLAVVLKSQAELKNSWETILKRRRLVEPDDRKPIDDQAVRTKMYHNWLNEFAQKEMTKEQRAKPHRSRASIFNAVLQRNFGGKQWIMAVWQYGITWVPDPDIMERDRHGALEHVAKHFAQWVRRLARTLARAQEQPDYTGEEEHPRDTREKACANHRRAIALQAELDASKAKGKRRGRKGKGKNASPRTWNELSAWEKFIVGEHRAGRLGEKKRKAEAISTHTLAQDLA